MKKKKELNIYQLNEYTEFKIQPKEKAEMLKAGFPLCYQGRHCRSCIGNYRERSKRQKEMIEDGLRDNFETRKK